MLRQNSSQLTRDERTKLDDIAHFEQRLLLADLREGAPM
ncbi:hypothetical protein ABIB94_000607 [Bradyrhizobium sp. JR7.2]|nr:hypothetical protein CDS [Bradyrhizobium sp.]